MAFLNPRAAQRLKNRVRLFIGRSEFLIYVLKLKRKYRRLMVSRKTDVVIEGAPGCGNSFAVQAFRLMQSGPVNVASHIHVPAQIKLATRFNVPTIVLIRDPLESVSSVLSRGAQLTPSEALIAYIDFYEEILLCNCRYILCPFEVLTSAFHRCIERLNTTYGTSFSARPLTQDEVDWIFSYALVHAKPEPARQAIKDRIKEKILRDHRELVDTGRSVYRMMLLRNVSEEM